MILPLSVPVFPGGVVRKSVSRLSNHRKSGPIVAPSNTRAEPDQRG